MDYTFRPALPTERDAADRVLRAAFTPYMRRLGREIPADYYKWLPASIERGDVFVADEAGLIVGVAATERRDTGLYLDRLAVDPTKQGTGLGSWLLVRLEEVARARADTTMSLETAEMMDHLIRLYRRHGFEIVRRGPPHHGLDPHIRVHMVKPLQLELHSAAYNADIEEVQRLLAGGAAPDTRDGRGYTPLMWASFRAAVADLVPVIEALVEAGADPNAMSGDSNCLILAAQSGNEPAVVALASAGAQVDAAANGITALMVAARAGELQIVQRLLELGANPSIRCGRFTAADYARYGGHDGLAEVIEGAAR